MPDRDRSNAGGISMPPPSVYIDLLSDKLGLTAPQVSDLQTLAMFGAEIPSGDLLLRLYGFSQSFKTQNLLEQLLNKDTGLNEVVKDMKSLTTEKWVPDPQQRKAMITAARKAMWSATTTSYMTLDHDTMLALEATAKDHGLEAVFRNDVRLETLARETRTMCSAIRSQFRVALRDSVFGSSKSSVNEICLDLGKKFGFCKDPKKIPAEHHVRVALLRRFMRENPETVDHAEVLPDSEEMSGAANATEESDAGESRKRRRTNNSKPKKTKGRPAKGRDFWALVDQWLQERVAEWGSDLGGEAWKSYLEETFRKEDEQSVGVQLSFSSLLSFPRPEVQHPESVQRQAEMRTPAAVATPLQPTNTLRSFTMTPSPAPCPPVNPQMLSHSRAPSTYVFGGPPSRSQTPPGDDVFHDPRSYSHMPSGDLFRSSLVSAQQHATPPFSPLNMRHVADRQSSHGAIEQFGGSLRHSGLSDGDPRDMPNLSNRRMGLNHLLVGHHGGYRQDSEQFVFGAGSARDGGLQNTASMGFSSPGPSHRPY